MTALNAMTVDVEEHFQVSAFAPMVSRSDWPRHESRVVDNTERLLDLFDGSKVQATFFVLGWVAEKHPGLVDTIARRGHEIGSHGWSHELIYDQSPEAFRSELEHSRKLLQDLSGQPVEGHRAASFSIVRRNTLVSGVPRMIPPSAAVVPSPPCVPLSQVNKPVTVISPSPSSVAPL